MTDSGQRKARPELPQARLAVPFLDIDKIIGLQEGAVSYVEKPFSPAEVVAEVRSILGRQP